MFCLQNLIFVHTFTHMVEVHKFFSPSQIEELRDAFPHMYVCWKTWKRLDWLKAAKVLSFDNLELTIKFTRIVISELMTKE